MDCMGPPALKAGWNQGISMNIFFRSSKNSYSSYCRIPFSFVSFTIKPMSKQTTSINILDPNGNSIFCSSVLHWIALSGISFRSIIRTIGLATKIIIVLLPI
jgi:hypothetical protein